MPAPQQRLSLSLVCGLLSYAIAFTASSGDATIRLEAAVLAAVIYSVLFLARGKTPRTVAAVSLVFALSGVFTGRHDAAFILVFVFSVVEALLSASVLVSLGRPARHGKDHYSDSPDLR